MRSWIATILFIVVTIVLSIVSVPAAVIDRSGRSYLALARAWSRSFLWLYGIRIVTQGEQLVSGLPTVYVSNHSSYVDIPVILASIQDDIRLMLRDSLTRIPIWGWALKVSPFLIISRENAARAKATLDNATATIRKGASVLLFPEGTRTSTGALQPFKRGAFKIALESCARVVPVYLDGAFDVLPRTEKLPRTNRTIHVHIGAAITLPSSHGRVAELELMQTAEAAMHALADASAQHSTA